MQLHIFGDGATEDGVRAVASSHLPPAIPRGCPHVIAEETDPLIGMVNPRLLLRRLQAQPLRQEALDLVHDSLGVIFGTNEANGEVGSTASAQHYLCFQPPSSEPYFRVSQDTALHFCIAVSMQTSS